MNQPKCILLDIEGTTSSISFVYDVMFPYIRENLAGFLKQNWESESVQQCLPLLAAELGHDSVEHWLGDLPAESRRTVEHAVGQLMDDDVKSTGLKQLQGAIWKAGFEFGQLVAHLYDDVEPAIRNWVSSGIEVRIYSSGSVQAQKLFFGHCLAGNLLPLLSAHYDTTTGPKQQTDSYRAIAADTGLRPGQVVFVSDVAEELDAAKEAGMLTALSIRPGNRPVANQHEYYAISRFDELDFSRCHVDARV